ncbi:sulfite exporter TauE/SafE family protein [Kosakonia sp. LAM2021]|uniref:sulfite exporter TauE/SafE family protein n=1 Tax=Kosakonia sp. LAM2021 TaxID=2800475 RepID=UPI001F17454B|nr:sulfite exporter TauE/SafE family protein [Kosakonia sp. LAM2021]
MFLQRPLYKDSLLFFRFFALILWLLLTVYITGFVSIAENYILSLSMMIGAFVGSATPVGGGVVAFPVLTFIKQIPAKEAAVFCLAMQSFGMSASSLAIYTRKIPVDKFLITWCVITSFIGYLLALFYIPNPFSSAGLKVFFSSFWLAFGAAIFLVRRKKTISQTIETAHASGWRLLLFISICFAGGIVTSWIGNGIDVVFFCVLILLFSRTESVATPSAVIVMALISIFATALNISAGNVSMQTLKYLSATIPVVIIFAPLGILFSIRHGDAFIRKLLLALVIIQYLFTAVAFFSQLDYLFLSMLVIALSFVLLFAIGCIDKRKAV